MWIDVGVKEPGFLMTAEAVESLLEHLGECLGQGRRGQSVGDTECWCAGCGHEVVPLVAGTGFCERCRVVADGITPTREVVRPV